jgi:hypothetical protein
LGALDYDTFLRELSKFPRTPLMLEHLPNAEEYRLAATHVRSVLRLRSALPAGRLVRRGGQV